MKKSLKLTIITIAFVLMIVIIIAGYNAEKNKKLQFQALNEKVVSLADTTADRVAKSVVTLPDGNMVVGLNNNTGTYTSPTNSAEGKVQIISELLRTNYISGIYGKSDPRLDAVVPMQVSIDSHGGSTYIVLFYDRGDVALEKSYARLGDITTLVESINTLPADRNVDNEDYKVDIQYKTRNSSTDSNNTGYKNSELIIPVISGHFDPAGSVSK